MNENTSLKVFRVDSFSLFSDQTTIALDVGIDI